MSGGRLTRLQRRILDLFWRNRRELGDLVRDAIDALHRDGLETHVLRTAPAFAELRVTDGVDACVVDLVAEPFPPVEAPIEADLEGKAIAVDTKRELLASKLSALLERSEIRDLADVKALLNAGGDLEGGLRDAPAKDSGFSPLTLAWVLRGYDPRPGARALGLDDAQAGELVAFQEWLVDRLTRLGAPE